MMRAGDASSDDDGRQTGARFDPWASGQGLYIAVLPPPVRLGIRLYVPGDAVPASWMELLP